MESPKRLRFRTPRNDSHTGRLERRQTRFLVHPVLFDSPPYFFFLLPVVLVYWRLRHRAQNIFLLLASYFFYAWWDWRFLALMIGSTTIDYVIAQRLAPRDADPKRKSWLIFSLVVNFGVLGVFKYF